MNEFLLRLTDKMFSPKNSQAISALACEDVINTINDTDQTSKLKKQDDITTTLLKVKKELLKSSAGNEVSICGSAFAALNQFLTSFTKAYSKPTFAVTYCTFPYIAEFALYNDCEIIFLPLNPLTLETNYSYLNAISDKQNVCVFIDNLCGIKDNINFGIQDNYYILNDLTDSFLIFDDEQKKTFKKGNFFSIFNLGFNCLDAGGIIRHNTTSELPQEFKFVCDNIQNSSLNLLPLKYFEYTRSSYKNRQRTSQNKATLWQLIVGLAQLNKLNQQQKCFVDNIKTWQELLTGQMLIQPLAQRKLTISPSTCPTYYPIILPNRNLAGQIKTKLASEKIFIDDLASKNPLPTKLYDELNKKSLFTLEYKQSELLAQKTLLLPMDATMTKHDIHNAFKLISNVIL